MYNNLIFLSNPVNGAQLLMQLTLWTFSVNSFIYIGGNKNVDNYSPEKSPYLMHNVPVTLCSVVTGRQTQVPVFYLCTQESELVQV